MATLTLFNVCKSYSRFSQIRILSEHTGLSLAESRAIILKLDKQERVTVEITNEEATLSAFENCGIWVDKSLLFDFPFDPEKTIAWLEREVVPFLDEYHLAGIPEEDSSLLLINHARSMAVLIESVRKNAFVVRYLLERGIQVREQKE